MQINVLPTVVYGYAYRMIYASSWTDYVIWNTNDRVKNGSNSIAIGLTMRLQHVHSRLRKIANPLALSIDSLPSKL